MILLALAAAATAHPAALHTYKEWIAGCDNIRSCQANALAPETSDYDDYLMLTIARGANPHDAAALSVPLPEKAAPGSRFTLKVDGAVVATFAAPAGGEARLPLTRALVAALLSGQRAVLVDAQGTNAGGASLAGLAAALLYFDDQQHRIGTMGALKAIGQRPDSTVPAPPAAPLIATPAPSPRPPRGISVGEATRLIGPDAATCDAANGQVNPQAYRLDAGHSLVLVALPCGNGAYNYYTSVFVVGEAGPPRPALFDAPPDMGDDASKPGPGDLTNGGWDPKSRRLTSFERVRGIGDCGSTESYAWDGTRFRLVEQNEIGECRGSVDYIRTWIARTAG